MRVADELVIDAQIVAAIRVEAEIARSAGARCAGSWRELVMQPLFVVDDEAVTLSSTTSGTAPREGDDGAEVMASSMTRPKRLRPVDECQETDKAC